MPIIPVHDDPVQADLQAIAREKQAALTELNRLAGLGLSLRRPVFFVPGWTGERCKAWTTPYTAKNQTAKSWVERIFQNAKSFCTYLNFQDDSPKCESFCDFGNVVRREIGDQTPCDCIGHSMGGLDIAAAIGMCHPPLLNVRNFITFGSPLRGTQFGDIAALLSKLGVKKLEPYQETQARNMDPDHPMIRQLQSPAVLRRILENTDRIYCFYGSRDLAIQKAGKLELQDIEPAWKSAPPAAVAQKVRNILYQGVEHSGSAGITQDPRTVLNLVRVLANVPLPDPSYNHGFVVHNP